MFSQFNKKVITYKIQRRGESTRESEREERERGGVGGGRETKRETWGKVEKGSR